MDYSIRIPATDERTKILDEQAKNKKRLTKIKDYLYKPEGVSLIDYHPDKVCIRLREFLEGDNPSSLVKIETTKTGAGYTDTKEKLGKGETQELFEKVKSMDYEKWGEIATVSTEYDLGYAQGLSQELSPIGTYLKIESPTQDGLTKTLKLLKASENEKIEKNAAVLLAEHMKLI